jgi:AraC-like DNA-binding protein
MSCINLREVLHLIVRYHPVLKLGPKWDLIKTADGMILRTPTSFNQAAGHRLMMETTFSTLFAIGENLLDGPINQIELQLNYPAPSHADAYKNYFAMSVKFGQEKCQALLLDDDLDCTLRTANPAGNVVFREQCEVMLRGLNQVDNISAAIRRLLIHAGREFPDIDTVARHLGIGERTLRRRLKSENSSFRSICDEVRNVLACRYLSSTQITVAEIAYLLGYSETVSFRRAFIRWNRITPHQFRKQCF